MAISAILMPGDTDEDFLRQFDHQTRFCIIPCHYNTSPTGWPIQKQLLQQKVPLIEQMMVEHPNVLFITNYWRNDLEKLSNVIFFSACILYHNYILKKQTVHAIKNQTLQCANLTGGKTRINRTLASHWLAKNFNLDKLLYNWTENNSLVPVKEIIARSKFFKRSHMNSKNFLNDTFVDAKEVGESTQERFFNHLLPNYYNKSLVSIIIETAGIELNNCIGEKTLFAMAGKCLLFFTGTYQIDSILQKIGFHTFNDIFDHKHLHNTDRYQLTVAGFENNKKILQDKKHLEALYHDNESYIQHNYDLACRSDHIKDYFAYELKQFKDAYKHVTIKNDTIGMWLPEVSSLY